MPTQIEMELKALRDERAELVAQHKQIYRYSQTDAFKALPRIKQSLISERNALMFSLLGILDDLISVYELEIGDDSIRQ
jgi:hypothetical protein